MAPCTSAVLNLSRRPCLRGHVAAVLLVSIITLLSSCEVMSMRCLKASAAASASTNSPPSMNLNTVLSSGGYDIASNRPRRNILAVSSHATPEKVVATTLIELNLQAGNMSAFVSTSDRQELIRRQADLLRVASTFHHVIVLEIPQIQAVFENEDDGPSSSPTPSTSTPSQSRRRERRLVGVSTAGSQGRIPRRTLLPSPSVAPQSCMVGKVALSAASSPAAPGRRFFKPNHVNDSDGCFCQCELDQCYSTVGCAPGSSCDTTGKCTLSDGTETWYSRRKCSKENVSDSAFRISVCDPEPFPVPGDAPPQLVAQFNSSGDLSACDDWTAFVATLNSTLGGSGLPASMVPVINFRGSRDPKGRSCAGLNAATIAAKVAASEPFILSCDGYVWAGGEFCVGGYELTVLEDTFNGDLSAVLAQNNFCSCGINYQIDWFTGISTYSDFRIRACSYVSGGFYWGAVNDYACGPLPQTITIDISLVPPCPFGFVSSPQAPDQCQQCSNTEPVPGSSFISAECTPFNDRTISPCSNPVPGLTYLLGQCDYAQDTALATCLPQPVTGTSFISSPCNNGSTVNVLADCSRPVIGTNFTASTCTAFSDASIIPCTEPIPGYYYAAYQCSEFSDTMLSWCSQPWNGYTYVDTPCNATHDTVLGYCSPQPDSTTYISAACSNGGSVNTLSNCSQPVIGTSYISSPCSNYYDAVISPCSVPVPGSTYIFAECSANSDAYILSCAEPTPGVTYLISQCNATADAVLGTCLPQAEPGLNYVSNPCNGSVSFNVLSDCSEPVDGGTYTVGVCTDTADTVLGTCPALTPSDCPAWAGAFVPCAPGNTARRGHPGGCGYIFYNDFMSSGSCDAFNITSTVTCETGANGGISLSQLYNPLTLSVASIHDVVEPSILCPNNALGAFNLSARLRISPKIYTFNSNADSSTFAFMDGSLPIPTGDDVYIDQMHGTGILPFPGTVNCVVDTYNNGYGIGTSLFNGTNLLADNHSWDLSYMAENIVTGDFIDHLFVYDGSALQWFIGGKPVFSRPVDILMPQPSVRVAFVGRTGGQVQNSFVGGPIGITCPI